jgi:hypothetical protein
VSALVLLVLGAGLHPLSDPLPGPDSPSTAWVLERVLHWAPSAEESRDVPILLDCLLTPGQPDTVGVRQFMSISAPLSEVAAVVEDFAHDAQLFPDLADVHVVKGSEEGNRFAVSWEQRVPVFFVPNVRYETTWLLERQEKRVSYRYKLKAKGTVKTTDGFIVLEDAGGGLTRYTEVDFIESATGPVSMATVWEMTLSGMFRSDVAIKLKAEHPGWTYPRLRSEADQLLERFPTTACFQKRHLREP